MNQSGFNRPPIDVIWQRANNTEEAQTGQNLLHQLQLSRTSAFCGADSTGIRPSQTSVEEGQTSEMCITHRHAGDKKTVKILPTIFDPKCKHLVGSGCSCRYFSE